MMLQRKRQEIIVQALLSQDGLFRTLFEVLPTAVILADPDAQVIALNSAGQRLFHTSDGEAGMEHIGQVFRCVNITKPGDCGQTVFCQDCLIRKAIRLAVDGKEIARSKGNYHTWKNGELIRLDILVTATRLEYQGRSLAVLIVEEISNITQLQGLLPICCSCYRIRDQEGDWTRLEEFIEKHSEADFTHDLCPECSERAKQAVR
jgi:hypothetical protein